MLSINDIAAWGITHPWASIDQIEQDLLLSRAICEIANDEYLGTKYLNPARFWQDIFCRHQNTYIYLRLFTTPIVVQLLYFSSLSGLGRCRLIHLRHSEMP